MIKEALITHRYIRAVLFLMLYIIHIIISQGMFTYIIYRTISIN